MKKVKHCFKLMNAFLKEKVGASAVEFAILAPIFLLLIIWFVELGIVLVIQNALEAGVREGGRSGITTTSGSGAQRQSSINQKIISTVVQFSGGIVDPNKINIYVSAYPTLQQNQPITASSSPNNYGGPGQTVNYLVTYTWNTVIPLFSTSNQITLQAASTFVIENSNP